MSIDNSSTIDFTGVDKESGEIILTISDHLPWEGDGSNGAQHLALLEKKLNAYLQFIESGQLSQDYPAAQGKRIVIRVVGKYPLSGEARVNFDRAAKMIEKAGYKLEFALFSK